MEMINFTAYARGIIGGVEAYNRYVQDLVPSHTRDVGGKLNSIDHPPQLPTPWLLADGYGEDSG